MKASHGSKETRRSRAARGSITRQKVVEGALALLDEQGMAGLTMPRLAERLGIGTMSLYRHVSGKADLVDAVGDLVLSELQVPEGEAGDWQSRVVGYLLMWRDVARAHPAVASILADRSLMVRSIHDQLDELLAIMQEAGLSREDAVRGFYSLLAYVLGFVVWELPRSPAQHAVAWAEALSELPERGYRTLHGVSDLLPTTTSEDQFRFGLALMVQSLGRRAALEPNRSVAGG